MGLVEKINCLNKNKEILHDLEIENRKLKVNNKFSKKKMSLNDKQKQISLLFEKNIDLERINHKNTQTQNLVKIILNIINIFC